MQFKATLILFFILPLGYVLLSISGATPMVLKLNLLLGLRYLLNKYPNTTNYNPNPGPNPGPELNLEPYTIGGFIGASLIVPTSLFGWSGLYYSVGSILLRGGVYAVSCVYRLFRMDHAYIRANIYRLTQLVRWHRLLRFPQESRLAELRRLLEEERLGRLGELDRWECYPGR